MHISTHATTHRGCTAHTSLPLHLADHLSIALHDLATTVAHSNASTTGIIAIDRRRIVHLCRCLSGLPLVAR
jgi:hypothetical protein